jgi:hypothetical protein
MGIAEAGTSVIIGVGMVEVWGEISHASEMLGVMVMDGIGVGEGSGERVGGWVGIAVTKALVGLWEGVRLTGLKVTSGIVPPAQPTQATVNRIAIT